MALQRQDSIAAAKQSYWRRYKFLAPYVPELIAIHRGLRPALQLSLGGDAELESAAPLIADFCRKAGLRWLAYRRAEQPRIIISREKALPPKTETGFGRLFGYPDCCIRRWKSLGGVQDWTFNGAPDFWRGPAQPFETNLFLRTTPFHLIKHLPCAPDCPATLRGARRLLAEIDSVDARLGGQIRVFGRLPVFTTDICAIGILLHGRLRGERVRYRHFFFDHGPGPFIARSRHNRPEDAALFDRLVGALARGDELRLAGGAVQVFRDNRPIESIERPNHLSWKLLKFR